MRSHSWSLATFALLFVVSTGCRSLPSASTASLLSTLRREQPDGKPAKPIKQGPLTQEESAEACVALAENLEREGHVKDAIVQYERARRLVPQQPALARRLAILYDLTGQPVEARREFDRALETGTPDADLLTDYGFFLLQTGELEDAEATLRDALRTSPHHRRASVNLGIALARQGRYEEAYQAFQPVVGKAAAHSNLGVVMLRQGKIAEAEQAFRKALQINPQLAQAKALLEDCEARLSAGRPWNSP